jgi:ubiquinone/menaquinone biosynthesis C-methylase UbiE
MHSIIRSLHDRCVSQRRARVLAGLLADLIPTNAKVLDVGCGNGLIAHLITQIKPSVSIQGVEVMPRPECMIECASFDGKILPVVGSSVDVCLFADVLHHTLDPKELLKEAYRVTKRHVLIKDHLCENGVDNVVLKFMDWIGNRPYGVFLPYNYQSRNKWSQHFLSRGLCVEAWNNNLPLYPFPFSSVFGRNLHFIALLEKTVLADGGN